VAPPLVPVRRPEGTHHRQSERQCLLDSVRGDQAVI